MNKRSIVTLAICFAIFLAAVIGFVSLADEVHEGETLAFDQSVLQAINTTASPVWDTFYLTVTQLGSVAGIVILTLIGLAVFIKKKKYTWAVILAASVAGAAVINLVLKLIFERSRPDLWEQLVTETSYSFPSGHAMISSMLAFALIAIAWRTRYRIAVAIAALLFMVLVSFSRLYLGVHYPTDILAGWLVSAAWLFVVLAVVRGWIYRRTTEKPSVTG